MSHFSDQGIHVLFMHKKKLCKTEAFLKSQGRSLKGRAISALKADPHVPFKELRLTQNNVM